MQTPRPTLTPLCLFLAVFLAVNSLSAQDVPRLQLKVKESLPVPAGIVRSIATATPQCDGQGNIYFHPVVPAPADPMSGPLVRISADGQHVVPISLASVPDFPNHTDIQAFAVGLRGEVHILAYKGDDLYLLHFDDEGTFRSDTKVDARFIVSQLAVFPTGEFLGVGEKIPDKSSDPRGAPFTAIFDRNGKLIQELSFAGDVKPKRDARPEQQGAAISLGEAVPADDGNIYLLRAAEKPLIFVISPAGKVVSKLTLDPPGDNFHGSNFSVASGKIVMVFFKPNNNSQNSGTFLYSLYDAQSGERQFDYGPTAETNGIFACYTPNQFTLLHVSDDGLSIVHAVPR